MCGYPTLLISGFINFNATDGTILLQRNDFLGYLTSKYYYATIYYYVHHYCTALEQINSGHTKSYHAVRWIFGIRIFVYSNLEKSLILH